MTIEKLRELQEQAGRHYPKGTAGGNEVAQAIEKRAAPAPHLLPIAEALEKAASECELWIDYLPDMVKPDQLQAETAGIRARVADYRKALKNLQEALDA